MIIHSSSNNDDDKNKRVFLLDQMLDLIKKYTTDEDDSLDFAAQFFASFCVAISKEGFEIVVFDEVVRKSVEYMLSLIDTKEGIFDSGKEENFVCQDLN